MFLPITLVYLDRLEEAEKAIESAKGVVGIDALVLAGEGLLWAKRGEREKAGRILTTAIESRGSVSHAHHTCHYAAAAYATLGETSRVVELLDLAARTGMPNYPAFSVDPHFDPIREQLDFKALMARLKSGWEALRTEFGEPTS